MRLRFYTGLALVVFAGNAGLCRQALDGGAINATYFSPIRLASAAAATAGYPRMGRNRAGARRPGTTGFAGVGAQ